MAVSTVTDTEPWRRKQRIIKALQETHGEAYSWNLTVHGINSSVSTGTFQHFFGKLTSSSSSPSSSLVVAVAVAVIDSFLSFPSYDDYNVLLSDIPSTYFLPSVQIGSVASEFSFFFPFLIFLLSLTSVIPSSSVLSSMWLSFLGSDASFFTHNASKIR